MSLVAITQHNENIRNILEPPAPLIQAPLSCGSCLYISKFRPKVLKDERKPKECHRTFGYATVPLPKPCEFLRKHSRIVPPRPIIRSKCSMSCRRPSLPTCQAKGNKTCPQEAKKPSAGKKFLCGKNFQQENICRVTHSAPRQPLPKFVDSQKGHTQHLIRSGLLPIYVHKKTYGKIPTYILSRKSTKAGEAVCQLEAKSEGPVIYPIPDEERQALLEGLRKNWNELQTAYQHMPILTDTMHKRLRKDRMEKELRRLEINISTLERHDQIYVVNDEQT